MEGREGREGKRRERERERERGRKKPPNIQGISNDQTRGGV